MAVVMYTEHSNNTLFSFKLPSFHVKLQTILGSYSAVNTFQYKDTFITTTFGNIYLNVLTKIANLRIYNIATGTLKSIHTFEEIITTIFVDRYLYLHGKAFLFTSYMIS
jgi:hypothetical protein